MHMLILILDPGLKEGKGLVYMKQFLGLKDDAFLNFRQLDSRHVVFMFIM